MWPKVGIGQGVAQCDRSLCSSGRDLRRMRMPVSLLKRGTCLLFRVMHRMLDQRKQDAEHLRNFVLLIVALAIDEHAHRLETADLALPLLARFQIGAERQSWL